MAKFLHVILPVLICAMLVLTGCTSEKPKESIPAPATAVVTPLPTTPAQSFESIPPSPISASEREDIIYLQEAEKCDHDLNFALANQRPTVPLFRSIADTTQVAMVTDNVILERYNISNPESQAEGKFTSQKLQRMYDTGVSSGSMSVTSALNSSAGYEDLHIADLVAAIGRTDNEDLKFIYQQELIISRNNLRDLVKTMAPYGSAYSPRYLSPEYYEEIISTPVEPMIWI